MPEQLGLTRPADGTHVPPPSRLGGACALALTLAVCLTAAGCGGSKHKTATTPAITKAQFLAQANALCTQGNQRLTATRKVFEKTVGNHEPTRAQATAYVNGSFAPNIQAQISAIRALGTPAGEQATVTHLLDLAQSALNQVKSNPAVLLSNRHPFRDFARGAHAYGMTSCASNA